MFGFQYRNFGTHQSMVVNHTVDIDPNGADVAGIRWYELRRNTGLWDIYQQGTFQSSNGEHVWMGSMAMDKEGNIALGYSASSSNFFPSIRYAGRRDGDPLHVMTLTEGNIFMGSGSQGHSSGRWGDYSRMTVSPDGCTFWYTNEYYSADSLAGWRTRIGSFQLEPSCVVSPPNTPPVLAIDLPVSGSTVMGTSVLVRISPKTSASRDGSSGSGIAYRVACRGGRSSSVARLSGARVVVEPGFADTSPGGSSSGRSMGSSRVYVCLTQAGVAAIVGSPRGSVGPSGCS